MAPCRITGAVAELLWRCFDEGPNGSEALQHCLGIIPLPEQGCCIPQLQGTALLLKVCTACSQTSQILRQTPYCLPQAL